MQKRYKTATKVHQSVGFLRQYIAECIKKGCDRLPSMDALAQEAGVSIVTMYRAVDILKKEHILATAPRRGITIVSNISSPESIEQSAAPSESPKYAIPKWQHIKNLLLEDIAKGTFAPDTVLPTIKELCHHYGTGTVIMRKAILALIEEKKIIRHKRGYKIAAVASPKPNGTLVLIGLFSSIDRLSNMSPHLKEFFSIIEDLQHQHLFKIKIFSYFDLTRSEIQNSTTLSDIENEHSVIGYIVLSTSLKLPYMMEILDKFTTSRHPVAIFDSSELQKKGSDSLTIPDYRIFRLLDESSKPGEDVGNYLFAKGHRSVAFFTASDQYQWSIKRADGIIKAMTTPDNPDPVEKFLYRFEASHIPSSRMAELQKILNISIDKSKRESFFRHLDVQNLMVSCHIANKMNPLFKKALGDPNITAWVGANDEIAVFANSFLYLNYIRVPEDISVIGFDNTFNALSYGITSYSFNLRTLADMILAYFFTPRYIRLKEDIRRVEIPGKIVERSSTLIGI